MVHIYYGILCSSLKDCELLITTDVEKSQDIYLKASYSTIQVTV